VNPPPSDGGDGGSTSSGWIAGAVIGPLAGVALIAFGVWFLRRRRRAAQPTQYVQEMAADPTLPGYVAEKTASNTEVPELGGAVKPPGAGLGELPSDTHVVHELPANAK
jgi:LPXTG-motif cell wall-anchored protein